MMTKSKPMARNTMSDKLRCKTKKQLTKKKGRVEEGRICLSNDTGPNGFLPAGMHDGHSVAEETPMSQTERSKAIHNELSTIPQREARQMSQMTGMRTENQVTNVLSMRDVEAHKMVVLPAHW